MIKNQRTISVSQNLCIKLKQKIMSENQYNRIPSILYIQSQLKQFIIYKIKLMKYQLKKNIVDTINRKGKNHNKQDMRFKIKIYKLKNNQISFMLKIVVIALMVKITSQVCMVTNCISCPKGEKCQTCSKSYNLTTSSTCSPTKNCTEWEINNNTGISQCKICDKGNYLDENKMCINNLQNCNVSDNTTQTCIVCVSGYLLDSQNYCINISNCNQSNHQKCTSCIDGYHFDNNNICTSIINCDPNILGCISCQFGQCNKCDIYFVLTSNVCQCQQHYILNLFTSTCIHISTYDSSNFINVNQNSNSLSLYLSFQYTKKINKADFDTLLLFIVTINVSRRLLQNQITLNILNIIIISNNQILLTFSNPTVNISANSHIFISLNNPSIKLSSTVYKIPNESNRKMHQVNQLLILISIFIIRIAIFASIYSKSFHHQDMNFSQYYKAINFIQRISLLRFNIPTVSSPFLLFGYYLKASYFNFGSIPNPDNPYVYLTGNIPISTNYNEVYFQPTKGGFTLLDIDANIIRNVGIAIIISIMMLILKVIGFILFKKYPQHQWKTSYYSFIQFFEKLVKFPIIYFCITTLYFQQIFPVESYPDPQRYHSFRVGAILYLVYFITLAVIQIIFTQMDTSLRVVRSFQFICDMMNAVILILTLGTNQTLLLILTIVLELALSIALNQQKQSKYVCFSCTITVSSKVTKFQIVKVIRTTLEIILLILIMASRMNIDNRNLIVTITFFAAVIICYLISMIVSPNDYQQTQVNAILTISQNIAIQSANAFTINDNKGQMNDQNKQI